MLRIGVDLDNVLIDFIRGLCQYHNAHFGTSLTRGDMPPYAFENVFGCTQEEAARRVQQFVHSIEHEDIPPLAPPAIIEDIHTRAEVYVVTARSHTAAQPTYKLLAKHFPSLADRVHFTNHSTQYETSKGDICRELGLILFVDDTPLHIEEVHPVVEHALLYSPPNTPWNDDYEPTAGNIYPVRSWEEIHAFITRLSTIS